MGLESYKVRVPGSLMLFGEHAVLYGHAALVAAINKYIIVELMPRFDRKVELVSSIFPPVTLSLDDLVIAKPYNFVLAAIAEYLPQCPSGFSLNISSEFSDAIGFGSSAAVVVATLAVLNMWLAPQKNDLYTLHHDATKVVRKLQGGVGSGADVAASVFGGVIVYNNQPVVVEKITAILPLVAVYSGSKMPTPNVIALVRAQVERFPQLISGIYAAIGCCTNAAIQHLKNSQVELDVLGSLMNIHHELQSALGTSNQILDQLVDQLRQFNETNNHIYGAKISGSGLGDCVVGLGAIQPNIFPQDAVQKQLGVKQLEVEISNRGMELL